jgi:hypothetical protein
VALLAGLPLWSQSPASARLAQLQIGEKLKQPGFDPADLTDVSGAYRQQFVQYLTAGPVFQATFRTLLQSVENGRVDEQLGGSASLAGAASAAEKAGITGLVTAALESGALSQTLDQNVLTLRGNAEGFFRFFARQEVLPVCRTSRETGCDPSPLNNLELTASFDVSKANTENVSGQNVSTGAQVGGLLTSDKRQFANASARYVVIGSRDLRSPAYRAAWNKWYAANVEALNKVTADLLQAQDAIFVPIQKDGPGGSDSIYTAWLKKAREAVMKAAASRNEAEVTTEVDRQWGLLETEIRKAVPSYDEKLAVLSSAYSRYFSTTRAGLDLSNRPLVTVVGAYSQPTLQPRLITAKFVFAWSPRRPGTANPGTLTLNGAVDLYTKAQPIDTKGGTGHWRDAQFALQYDRPMGGASNPVSISLGGYFQYQINPGLIVIPAGSTLLQNVTLPPNGLELLTKRGTVAVAHAGITLQLPNTSIRMPIGVSWSNRTELVTGSEIRGHIGFSFDSHSLALQK